MSKQRLDGVLLHFYFTFTLPDENPFSTKEPSTCPINEKHIHVVKIADAFGEPDNTVAMTCTQCITRESHLCPWSVGKNVVYFASCVFPFVLVPIQFRIIFLLFNLFIIMFQFILLYSYIHILSDWANCSCSCILCRFNYTPLWAAWKKKKLRVGKEGCVKKVWVSGKKCGGKKARRGLRRGLRRAWGLQRRKRGGWEPRSRRDKLERRVRAVPWVTYLCKGEICSLECTL